MKHTRQLPVRLPPYPDELPDALPATAFAAARRAAIGAEFPGDRLVIPAGELKVRSNDTHFRFRPSSDFYYLVGSHEPDSVLVMSPDGIGGHVDRLFVEPNPGRSDATFFTDRAKGELWVGLGARLGVPQSKARFAVHEASPLGELPGLDGWVTQALYAPDGATLLTLGGGHAAHLWRTSDRSLLARLEVGETPTHAAFSRDGARLLIADDQGDVLVGIVREATLKVDGIEDGLLRGFYDRLKDVTNKPGMDRNTDDLKRKLGVDENGNGRS